MFFLTKKSIINNFKMYQNKNFNCCLNSVNKSKLKSIRKYIIILEPAKRNTAPAILSSALIKEIPENQPLIFLTSDHLIEKINLFNKSIKKHQKYLTDKNIFIFGIKPSYPSSDFVIFYQIGLRINTRFLNLLKNQI